MFPACAITLAKWLDTHANSEFGQLDTFLAAPEVKESKWSSSPDSLVGQVNTGPVLTANSIESMEASRMATKPVETLTPVEMVDDEVNSIIAESKRIDSCSLIYFRSPMRI